MKLIQNINQLLVTGAYDKPLRGAEMSVLNHVDNAFVLIDKGRIYDYGPMDDFPLTVGIDEVIDATGCVVLPSWCDSHTHLVFADSREDEFSMRLQGASYQDIGAAGGGILNSARKLAEKHEDDLFEEAKIRLQRVINQGTGAIEIKTGYGLSVNAERKMLEVIARLQQYFDIPIKATLLAAHAIPENYKNDPDAYVDLIVNEMIPAFTKAGLVQFIDCFCEEGYFTPEQMDRILTAGSAYGLKPKVHVNQFNAIGGIRIATQHKALSVDHLEVIEEKDIEALRASDTIAVALPGCSFFLGIPYTDVRRLITNHIPIAIATDYNPGSAPSGNMNFTVAQACINLKMTPAEAINAATINAAFAMDAAEDVGSITKGKRANLIITRPLKSYEVIPYHFGDTDITHTILNGHISHVT